MAAGSQRSLPDLVARLRLDLSQAKTALNETKASIATLGVEAGKSAQVITAEVTKGSLQQAAAVGELGKQLKAIGTEGEAGAAKAVSGLSRMTAAAKLLGEQLTRVAEKGALAAETTGRIGAKAGLEGTGGIAGGFGGLLGASGAGGIPVLGAGVVGLGVLSGVTAGLAELSKKTAEYSASVLRNSELLGMNTDQFQTLASAAGKFGIEHEDLTRVLIRFQSNLEKGAPMLASMGLNLKDVGITSTDTGTAIKELSTWLSNNTDASQKNAVAVALMGKGSAALNEILSKGPAFLSEYQKWLESTGQLLTENQLKTGALAEAVSLNFQGALKGIEMQVGVNLQAAFTVLEQAMIGALGGGKVAFENIGKAIAEVVGWVATFVATLTGQDMGGIMNGISTAASGANAQLTGAGDAAKNAGDAFNGMGGAAGKAANSMKGLQDAAKDKIDSITAATKKATDAIDNQVSAINEAYNAETLALHNTETAMADKLRVADLLQAQSDAAHTSLLSQLQDELNALNETGNASRHAGENLLQYQRRLKAEDLKDKIAKETDSRKLTKTTTELAIDHLRQETAAQIQALDKTKKAQLDTLGEQKKAKQEASTAEIKAIQDVLADQVAAASGAGKAHGAAAQGIAAGYKATGTSVSTNMMKAFTDIGKQSHETAVAMADDLKHIFDGSNGVVEAASKLFGHLITGMAEGAYHAFQSLSWEQRVLAGMAIGGFMAGPWGAAGGAAIGLMVGMPSGGADTSGAPHGFQLPSWAGVLDPTGALSSKPPIGGGAIGVIQGSGLGAPTGSSSAGARPAGARAAGGAALANAPYTWQEAGMEMFVSPKAGQILSHDDTMRVLAGAGGINVNFNGNVATEYVADLVIQRIDRLHRQRAGSSRIR